MACERAAGLEHVVITHAAAVAIVVVAVNVAVAAKSRLRRCRHRTEIKTFRLTIFIAAIIDCSQTTLATCRGWQQQQYKAHEQHVASALEATNLIAALVIAFSNVASSVFAN